jgi:hypothetical protein
LSGQLLSNSRTALRQHAVVTVLKTRVVEQGVTERQLPRIIGRQESGRHDRLLIDARLTRRRLRNRPACAAKRQEDQDPARYITAGSGGDRRQFEAVARGRHGQFTVQ